MRFLIIGCGSIGMRHMRNLKALGWTDLMASDPVGERRARAIQECGAEPFESLEEALAAKPEVAFVTTPSSLHLPIALQAAQAGCHLFIEKPLSHTAEGLDELLEVVRQKRLQTMVACNMRFHHGPAAVKGLIQAGAIGKITSACIEAGYYLPDWHPERDYRKQYSSQESLGGGVILDAIHEIDYARWLLGEVTEVFCMGGKLSSLDIDVEDSANILMKFKTGFSAVVHVDYIQRAYARSCKIIGEEGTIMWKFGGQVKWFLAKTKQWTALDPPLTYNVNDMYVEELRHYLDCVCHGRQPICDIADGTRTLRLALAIKQSMITRERLEL